MLHCSGFQWRDIVREEKKLADLFSIYPHTLPSSLHTSYLASYNKSQIVGFIHSDSPCLLSTAVMMLR